MYAEGPGDKVSWVLEINFKSYSKRDRWMIDRPTDNTNMAKRLQSLNRSPGFIGLFFKLFF